MQTVMMSSRGANIGDDGAQSEQLKEKPFGLFSSCRRGSAFRRKPWMPFRIKANSCAFVDSGVYALAWHNQAWSASTCFAVIFAKK
jgi:hypothetical protein